MTDKMTKIIFEFEDGSKGNYIGDCHLLHDDNLIIIEKDNKVNIAKLYIGSNGRWGWRDSKILPRDYVKIEVEKIKRNFTRDWFTEYLRYSFREKYGLKCYLPTHCIRYHKQMGSLIAKKCNKFEIYFFVNDKPIKLFGEEDDVADYRVIYSDAHSAYYILTHYDMRYSLVHMDLEDENAKLDYIVKNAEYYNEVTAITVDNFCDEAKIIRFYNVPTENGFENFIYDIGNKRKSGVKTTTKRQKIVDGAGCQKDSNYQLYLDQKAKFAAQNNDESNANIDESIL